MPGMASNLELKEWILLGIHYLILNIKHVALFRKPLIGGAAHCALVSQMGTVQCHCEIYVLFHHNFPSQISLFCTVPN